MDGRNLNHISKIAHPDMTICSAIRFKRCLHVRTPGVGIASRKKPLELLQIIGKILSRRS